MRMWLQPSRENFPAPPPGWAELRAESGRLGWGAGEVLASWWGRGIMIEVSEAALRIVEKYNSLSAG